MSLKGVLPDPRNWGDCALLSTGALLAGLLLHWGCSSPGLKKISAYMKSSRFLPTPMYSKMATWGNKADFTPAPENCLKIQYSLVCSSDPRAAAAQAWFELNKA
ncbi:Hypothetical predicted protein [Marmota monax]|uniref:Uncharacterized protein n=1 Tax=Marmota monax TaxID=9995 RepID=A0A5E4BHT6_MARMO|nr:hypothetical protein GHT09_003578 [Marmota monax]VTJ68756.1 Hypothetical predicted protein [Marmota monax]